MNKPKGIHEIWWKLGDVWSWIEGFAHRRARGCRRRWQSVEVKDKRLLALWETFLKGKQQ